MITSIQSTLLDNKTKSIAIQKINHSPIASQSSFYLNSRWKKSVKANFVADKRHLERRERYTRKKNEKAFYICYQRRENAIFVLLSRCPLYQKNKTKQNKRKQTKTHYFYPPIVCLVWFTMYNVNQTKQKFISVSEQRSLFSSSFFTLISARENFFYLD